LGPAWEKFLGNMGDTLKLFRSLKKVFDPNGVLGNPGIFDPEEVKRLGDETR
jgi:FAD/FMN-containing dehydrogenase